ncbi:MAG: hypothetical protein B7Z57_11670 [Acidiphilium sp. 37-60-79]|nr:MAG: hypothetical protein B7Z57_11670 [Acidiphilium sp. 37-60-79]
MSGEVRVSFKTGSLNFFRVAIERARMPDWMKGPVENLAPFQLLVGYSEHVGLVRVLPDGDVMVKCAPCPARNRRHFNPADCAVRTAVPGLPARFASADGV